MFTHRSIRVALAALAVGFTVGCDDDPTGPETLATFTVEVSGETFRVAVTTQAQVKEFEDRIKAGGQAVVNGPLIKGNGGFNSPWSWHLDPAKVHTADATVEVCDGRPSMVEKDLNYWLGTVKAFCPWGAKIVKREK